MASDRSTSTWKTTRKPELNFQNRVGELKESLMIWRNILLPLNNLLEWENKYDPFIVFGIITFIFIFIFQTDPPVLTLISCIVLAIVLIDLSVPFLVGFLFKKDKWTQTKDAKFNRICERIAHFEQHVKDMCEAALKMRRERPLMYLMVGAILLAFIAFCGQRIDNLLLSYLTTLCLCLMPGISNRNLITLARQSLIDFWNNKKTNVQTTSTNETASFNSATSYPTVRTNTVIRPSYNQVTHTLYSTTAYGSNKSKAQ